MAKEYFLIGFRTTIMKQGWKVIDREVNIDEDIAEKVFQARNNFKKLLEKYDLIITESKRWFK